MYTKTLIMRKTAILEVLKEYLEGTTGDIKMKFLEGLADAIDMKLKNELPLERGISIIGEESAKAGSKLAAMFICGSPLVLDTVENNEAIKRMEMANKKVLIVGDPLSNPFITKMPLRSMKEMCEDVERLMIKQTPFPEDEIIEGANGFKKHLSSKSEFRSQRRKGNKPRIKNKKL